jgi:phage protein D
MIKFLEDRKNKKEEEARLKEVQKADRENRRKEKLLLQEQRRKEREEKKQNKDLKKKKTDFIIPDNSLLDLTRKQSSLYNI